VEILAYLYDADGTDQEIKPEDAVLENLNNKQLLWINVLKRDKQFIHQISKALNLSDVPVKNILNISERPTIEKFHDFYRLFVVSVNIDDDGKLQQVPIDYLIGKNFVLTIHDGDVDYFQEFRDREKGETQLGKLDAESFLATLLDMHIVTYFRALEKVERTVDKLDDRILKRNLRDEDFISDMVNLRRDVSKLRRWFLPHRDVFYGLSRPDFNPVAESNSAADFQMLSQHFENAVDAIESSRDTVLSLFDLYTTKSSHNMNNLMKRLTFVTLVVGGLGAIAGVWGMNFEVEYFKWAETGFWLTMIVMGLFVLGAIVVAKLFRWF
jgi:magnesium/cobalt transport protein CorA